MSLLKYNGLYSGGTGNWRTRWTNEWILVGIWLKFNKEKQTKILTMLKKVKVTGLLLSDVKKSDITTG